MHKHAKNHHKKTDPLALLVKREGNYLGEGVNHEKKKFRGRLDLLSVVDKKGVFINFSAVGIEGNELNSETSLYNSETVLYNEEASIICHDNKNNLTLWTLNSNIGTMARFDLRRFRQVSNKHSLMIFGYGDPEDKNVFREEITIELWDNNDLSYNYSWGEAGGLFLSRSTIRMNKTN